MPAKAVKLVAWSPEADMLLAALKARARAEGVEIKSDAAAIREAMAVAAEAPAAAWERARKRAAK